MHQVEIVSKFKEVKVGNLFFSTCSDVSKSICVELGKVEGGS